MNRSDLETLVSERTGKSKKDVSEVIEATLKAISESVAAGTEVRLPGFGIFARKETAEKQGRNPRTGETMTIAAAKKPVFKPGKALIDSVNA